MRNSFNLKAAYGAAVRAEPHKYEEAPAKYPTVWAEDAPKDERSEGGTAVGPEDRLRGWGQGHGAGDQCWGPSISYVEGCAQVVIAHS
jgi:hypothetical protein